MKKTTPLLIIGILCLSMFAVVAPRAKAAANQTALQVAEKAATWTISQAISENGGYKWADYMQGLYYDSSVQYGSAGYGTLYLELYNKTGNPTYLDYAKGAAQWIISQAVPDSGGYKWPHHDDDIPSPGWWLSPIVSGIGDFLLKMYQTTGNTTYLSYATGAAHWLMAMAYWGEPGCFIPYNPPNPYGTQAAHGISPGREAYTVTFLLHMYEETGNGTYLTYVKGTADWLISGPDKVTDPSGYKWAFNRPYGSIYSIDGNGQIALFFYEIYQKLGNVTYLEYAKGTMNWLLSQAVLNGSTAKWFDPVQGGYQILPFSGSWVGGLGGFFGVPDPNELLTAVYEMTHNATYLDYATKLANWITSPTMAIPEGGGYKFQTAEGRSTYSAYQNARIYNFLTWLYNATGETIYSNYVDGALQWIIFNATEANGGYAWRTISYYPYDASWFESGAAGIGYYLVASNGASMIINPSPDLLSLPAEPYGVPYQLLTDSTKQLVSLSSQVIEASPNQKIPLTLTFKCASPTNPTEIDQLYFVESWAPNWPPNGYNITVYNGEPGSPPGVTETKTVSFTTPNQNGTCYLWFCFGAQYSMQDQINLMTTSMKGLPAHVKIVVSNPQPVLSHSLSIKLGGDFAYTSTDSTAVKISALVEDPNINQPVSGADVKIKIYDPENNTWISSQMTEMTNQPGIYSWQSSQTVQEIFQQGGKGTYIVYATASKQNYTQAEDMFEFHIDPAKGNSWPILTIIIAGAAALLIVLIATLALYKKRKTR